MAHTGAIQENRQVHETVGQAAHRRHFLGAAHHYGGCHHHLDFQGPELKSIIQINPDAIKIASKLDQELSSGNIRGPLHGIPVVLKDNIDTDDKMNTTAGSIILKNSKLF